MKVLVAFSSKHGATAGIAERLASRFTARSLQAEAVDIKEKPDPVEYDAVVLGSAVYVGSWQKEAVAFAREHAAELRVRPLWLFSSGPLAEPSLEEPKSVTELRAMLQPRGHRVFPGALDKAKLSFPEKFVIRAVGAQLNQELEGDFRNCGGR